VIIPNSESSERLIMLARKNSNSLTSPRIPWSYGEHFIQIMTIEVCLELVVRLLLFLKPSKT
jgi:hypothetical protein